MRGKTHNDWRSLTSLVGTKDLNTDILNHEVVETSDYFVVVHNYGVGCHMVYNVLNNGYMDVRKSRPSG